MSRLATMDFERTFLAQLPLIDRILGSICRRHALSGDEAEEFQARARLKLIENDYAVLRKFECRSSVQTYLEVVLANVFRDFCIERRGRWRASATARRLGPLAVRLERLVHRDGYAVSEAVSLVRNRLDIEASERELRELVARLPERRLRPVLERVPDDLPATSIGGDPVDEYEREFERAKVEAALEAVLRTLDAEDRVILRLRFWCGLTVAEVARAMGMQQKPLYRRIARLMRELRIELDARGVGAECIGPLFP